MGQALSISALARSTGVTSKTLRHWEHIGLLPKAARTHAGYRIFGAEANHYIEFILKAKSVGLTLSEMKRVIEFARQGKNPCPEVVKWIDEKDRAVEHQIHSLRAKAEAVSPHLLSVFGDDLCAGGGTVLPDRRFAEPTISERRRS